MARIYLQEFKECQCHQNQIRLIRNTDVLLLLNGRKMSIERLEMSSELCVVHERVLAIVFKLNVCGFVYRLHANNYLC